MKDKLNKTIFSDILNTLLDKGFEVPIFWIATAANGSVLSGKYEKVQDNDDPICCLLAEHIVKDTFENPVALMAADKNNRSVWIIIQSDGKFEFYN